MEGHEPKYDFYIKLFTVITLISIIILTILLEFVTTVDPWIIYIMTGIIGMGFNAFMPFAA